MATQELVTAVGVFREHAQADRAVDDLKRAGFRDDQIGVVTRHPDGNASPKDQSDTAWEEGTVAGLLTGAGLGTLVGLGVLAGVVPVIGPVIVGGSLAVVLANAAGGAVIAGLVGALVGLGIPESEALYYEGEIKEGRTIVTVKADGRISEASAILQRNGGYDRSTATTVDMRVPPDLAARAASWSEPVGAQRLHRK